MNASFFSHNTVTVNQNAAQDKGCPRPTRFGGARSVLRAPALALVLFGPLMSYAQPVGVNGATIEAHFTFPVAEDAALVSFDWDASGALHYTVGDPGWGTKLEVYKTAAPDDIQVFQSAEVWAGSRITCVGDFMYFNDGGDYMRAAFNYFMYPAATADTVTPLLEYPYDASLWGLATRNPDEFFASGSEIDWGPAALYYNTLDEFGAFAGALAKFADIGESPGPLAFDDAGNLYYAHGYVYSGTATIYRWDAAAVAAALADPANAALAAAGNEWAVLPAPYDGATGMATDGAGNLYVTATAWDSPSRLLFYEAASATPFVVGEYGGRLETVRYRNGDIHFSCADGVFTLPLPQAVSATDSTTLYAAPGETVLLAVQSVGGVGTLSYQWYRVSDEKADAPVGDNQPTYAFTAALADSGAEFFCVITDDVALAESPRFTVIVQESMPAPGGAPLVLGALLMATLGAWRLVKRMRPAGGPA